MTGENLVMISEKDIGAMQECLENMRGTVAQLDETINGNGRAGIKETVIRLEDGQTQLLDEAKGREEKLDKLLSEMGELKSLVKEHLEDKYIHSLPGLIRIAPYKFLLWLIAISVVMHTIIETFTPPNMDFWEVIRHFIGL